MNASSFWNKSTAEYESSAKVVDGNIIISLPDAVNPIVWRMELGSVKASAMEVRSHADGTFMLALKTPKGEAHDIAPFAQKELAVRALMRVSAALQSAEGRMGAPAATPIPFPERTQASEPRTERTSALKWLLALGGVFIVIALFAYLGTLGAPAVYSGDTNSATTVTGDQNAESGVPQSADSALQGF